LNHWRVESLGQRLKVGGSGDASAASDDHRSLGIRQPSGHLLDLLG
jgi:hypothetical protein